jgi:hypothetical protein
MVVDAGALAIRARRWLSYFLARRSRLAFSMEIAIFFCL